MVFTLIGYISVETRDSLESRRKSMGQLKTFCDESKEKKQGSTEMGVFGVI